MKNKELWKDARSIDRFVANLIDEIETLEKENQEQEAEIERLKEENSILLDQINLSNTITERS